MPPTVEVASSMPWRSMPRWSPPLITAQRERCIAGARLHQARAMDADATEVRALEVNARVAAPTHYYSTRTTHRRSSSSPSPRYGR